MKTPRNRVDKYKSIRKKKRKGFCRAPSNDVVEDSISFAVQQCDGVPSTSDTEVLPSSSTDMDELSTKRLSAMENKLSHPLKQTPTKINTLNEYFDTCENDVSIRWI